MDELLMRGMPHSAEAEQAVLGSMLIDGNCVKDVMDQLQADDFYLRQNREIFETIAHMFVYSQPVDGVTVAGEMEKNGLYTEATRPYLLQLMEVTPTAANVGEYVKIVRDKALMRQVATAAANITAMVQEGGASAADMLESAEQRVYAIRRGRGAQTMVPVSQVLQDVMVRLEELSNSESNLAGLSTGFSAVDGKINGLNKSDLLLLAAGQEQLSKDRCCAYLTKVGLCANDYLDREVDVSLSGGEVKRIEIATILARHSDLMIFDEPEAGIDLWSFARLTETFEQIHQEGKATMIIISHQERIIRLADEIVVIANGQIAHRGNTEEVFPLILADTLGGCPVIERKEASL